MNIENQEIPKKSFKEFVKENKVIIISFLTLLVLGLLVFIGFNEYTKKKNLLVSENFNKAKILIDRNNNEEALKILEKIVYKNNKFYSPLSLNIILEKKLIKDKNYILLTEKEIQLLELFLDSKKPISKNMILKEVWKYSTSADTHTVETHIYRLRKKIKVKFEDENFILNSKDGYLLWKKETNLQ